MEKIYIYGAGYCGERLQNIIETYYFSKIEIEAFIDSNKTGTLNNNKIVDINSVQHDAKIIIAIVSISSAIDIYKKLKNLGYFNIWRFLEWNDSKGDFFENLCVDCRDWERGVLPQVEMHIMDSCNLNCKGCSHFSPIFENIIPNIDSRINDVKQLSKILGYIDSFYILGGEPFLNPEIGEYALRITEILNKTKIIIVTNGLLITKASEQNLKKIKESRAIVSISEYQPTKNIIKQITNRLAQYDIKYEIRVIDTKMKFNKPLSLSDNSKRERLCISDECVTIWNGKIARCPTLMYIEHFNKTFKTSLPTEGIYSLYDDGIEGINLVEKLKTPISLCNHCVKNEIEWGVCEKKYDISDFASLD